MSDKPVLYGFDGSTYVRTVRMLLAEKGVDYDQTQVNVLTGEPRQAEHLARHPFGKVPVLDIDGIRIRETSAICRYLNDALEGPSFIPEDVKARARMDEAMSLTDSYGYNALIGAAGYHLFPDFLGNPDEAALAASREKSTMLLTLLMENSGGSLWLAGSAPSLADFLLGPIFFYVALTPEKDAMLAIPGMSAWWEQMSAWPSFKATEPDLG